jgi:Domain of unknown function (DUF6438)
MNKWILAIVAATALAGCKTHSGDGYGYGHAGKVKSITYETGPCFGTCPVYTVTVRADGTGLFTGQNHTTVTGNQAFTVTPSQYAQFVNHLAPIRPASGTERHQSGSDCTSIITDLPSTDVKWQSVDGQQQELFVYHGCRFPNSQAMVERLQQAPDLLPIGSFIH